MNLMKTPLEKFRGALEVATRRLADFEAERASKAAQVEATSDFDAGFALREGLVVLDRKIEAAIAAKDHAAGQVERAQKEADQAEADRRHAAAQKLARAGEKLTLDVAAAAEKLADLLTALQANRAQVEEANAVRGGRPFIVDGERKVREMPAREMPAVTRREKAWVDAAGERPSQLVERDGRLVPAGGRGDYTFQEVEVVEQAARHLPAVMPERFADAFHIVDLHGRRIFPRS